MAFFPLVATVRVTLCSKSCRRLLEITSEENDRDCKRQTFKSQRRHACIVKQNNPNNPSRTGNKGRNPAPLPRSWDRFIIQAKANFDKQLETISPNLWVILSNMQSTIRGKGSLKVMKKCATTVPLGEKKRTCLKKNVSIIIKWDKLY